jgi:hypothetical protein
MVNVARALAESSLDQRCECCLQARPQAAREA